jgi:hypothetical protein
MPRLRILGVRVSPNASDFVLNNGPLLAGRLLCSLLMQRLDDGRRCRLCKSFSGPEASS